MELCCVCAGAPCAQLQLVSGPHRYCAGHFPRAAVKPPQSIQARAGMTAMNGTRAMVLAASIYSISSAAAI